jgi:hypothetical protein
MMTATMMLMGSVMIAQAAGAGPAFRDGQRPAPSPVSTFALLGLTQDVRAMSTVENVRIEKLPVEDVRGSAVPVQFLVEPRVLATFDYRAELSVNGEPMSARRIAPRSAVVLEAMVPADGELHEMCVSVQRLADGAASAQVARRCFDVVVQPGGQD